MQMLTIPTDTSVFRDTTVQMCCVGCSAADAYDILSGCLHSVCCRCLVSLKLDDGYLCTCKEFSSKVIHNPTLSKSENLPKSPNCNWCYDNGEQTKSIGNCRECDVWLCGECLKGHNRMPPLRSHTITTLPITSNQEGLRCEIHPHENLECFCEACGILTCRDCQLSVHRDHGSHRWVGEKANLLKSPLEQAIKCLEQYQVKLSDCSQIAMSACTNTKVDSFLGSAEKTRSDIEARASSLMLRIRSRADALLKEVNTRCSESVEQLRAANAVMKELQNQIAFTLAFANRLIMNKDADPASLVQVFDAIHARMKLLETRAKLILTDAPASADAVELGTSHGFSDPSYWRKETLGWRSTADTRAIFIANWDPEELAKHSGTVAWLPVYNLTNSISKFNDHTAPFPAFDAESQENGKDSVSPQCEAEMYNKEYDDFLDSLALIDGRNRNPNSASEQPVGGVGCAICFGAGLLAHCGKCRRAYHLDCHLPRLTNVSLVSGWVCGLCADKDAADAAHVEHLDGTRLPHTDYLAGCRILMGLLVHAEAVHFTASVCPACSVPLLTPGRTVPHCPAGHLYHRLAELRLQLEEAASPEEGGVQQLDDLEDHDQKPPSGGRIPLTRLDDWLVEVDKFWSDAANETNHVRGATAGCLRAARRLRAGLDMLIKIHRPQSLASLAAAWGDPSLRKSELIMDEPVCKPFDVDADGTVVAIDAR